MSLQVTSQSISAVQFSLCCSVQHRQEPECAMAIGTKQSWMLNITSESHPARATQVKALLISLREKAVPLGMICVSFQEKGTHSYAHSGPSWSWEGFGKVWRVKDCSVPTLTDLYWEVLLNAVKPVLPVQKELAVFSSSQSISPVEPWFFTLALDQAKGTHGDRFPNFAGKGP